MARVKLKVALIEELQGYMKWRVEEAVEMDSAN